MATRGSRYGEANAAEPVTPKRGAPRLDPEPVVAQIINLYVDHGLSTYRIAQETGVDRQRVTRILHRSGIAVSPKGRDRSRPPRAADDPSEQDLRRLYLEEGLTTPTIGRILGIPDRRIRERLARYGIERRHRGAWDRHDRIEVDPHDINDLYVSKELPADEVGNHLGVSLGIVLRSAHSYGLPVRPGGAQSLAVPDIQLIRALYSDPEVARTLRRHRVPVVKAPGALWERFPRPVPLADTLLTDLYLGCGLSSFQIELVTGQPSMTVLHKLAQAGIARRPRGGQSPFLLRWRGRRST
jgi:hypothetical protein